MLFLIIEEILHYLYYNASIMYIKIKLKFYTWIYIFYV